MVNYRYEFIDRQRVERNVAARFVKWRADFTAETGLSLSISSGVRTAREQRSGYLRYLAGQSGGVKWAKPSESSHCEVGPSGPRALDIRDSGADAGVTVKGSTRWQIAVRLGGKHGFTWGGWGVPDYEGWHFENHAITVGVYQDMPAAPAPVPGIARPAAMLAWRWTGIQRMLKGTGRYAGRIDNDPGVNTVRGLQSFLNAAGYARRAIGAELPVDGALDATTCKAVQQWLTQKWGYAGPIDAAPGTGTKAAWGRAEAANGRAFAAVSRSAGARMPRPPGLFDEDGSASAAWVRQPRRWRRPRPRPGHLTGGPGRVRAPHDTGAPASGRPRHPSLTRRRA
ncbi:hypothetical protein GCM10022240_11370 [Microbacterium kribbense]|uniref:Peptidase M15C domain-containing protein n=1 Tax=Microbacterium kribbense TaxID=433645 RepID=A0ABP7GEX5_9MICO